MSICINIATVYTSIDCFKCRVSRSVSIFGPTTGYRVYTVSRESTRLPCLVFNNLVHTILNSSPSNIAFLVS